MCACANLIPTISLNDASVAGTKPDASDGMAMSHDGTLFFGGLHTSAVYSWRPADSAVNPLSGLKPVLQSDAELHWVDTFGFMPNGGKF